MARLQLLGGSYKQAGLIAAAQRSYNLYSEKNPDESQPGAKVTQYCRPGLTPLSAPPDGQVGAGRGLYTATNGDLYAVVGQNIFFIDQDWRWTFIGAHIDISPNPVRIADNGVTAILVDGDTSGNFIDLASRTVSVIGDPNFLGSNSVDFLDGFLVLNQIDSPNWYCTDLYSNVFNALNFGTKTAWPDNIVYVVCVEREAWIMGKYKSEVWFNSGGVPFPFNAQPGVIVEHGCVAPYSVAKQDVNLFWLSQSPEGARMIMKNKAHTAVRISTHAMEEEFLTYPRVDDAIGSTFQVRGHAFYKIDFPTADRSWVIDMATGETAEWGYNDKNGFQHRTRWTQVAYAYGRNVCLDWSTGTLYQLDENNFTDNEEPIVRIRSMPHMLDENSFNRITINKFIADMQTGAGTGTVNMPTINSPWSLGFNAGFGPRQYVEEPLVSLRVSRDRGYSFGNAVMKPMGAAGMPRVTPTWYRNGYGRDFIFELSWSTPQFTALDSCFIEFEIHEADQ